MPCGCRCSFRFCSCLLQRSVWGHSLQDRRKSATWSFSEASPKHRSLQGGSQPGGGRSSSVKSSRCCSKEPNLQNCNTTVVCQGNGLNPDQERHFLIALFCHILNHNRFNGGRQKKSDWNLSHSFWEKLLVLMSQNKRKSHQLWGILIVKRPQ